VEAVEGQIDVRDDIYDADTLPQISRYSLHQDESLSYEIPPETPVQNTSIVY
jgi:hypothetical protein